MRLLTLDDAKDHLRVDDTAEDGYIAALIPAAEAAIEDMLGRPLIGEGGWSDVDTVPANIVHAVKLAIGELYANREADLSAFATISVLLGRHVRVSFA